MEIISNNIMLVVAVLLSLSVLVGKAGSRYGMPALLLFLGVGMVPGVDASNEWLEPVDADQYDKLPWPYDRNLWDFTPIGHIDYSSERQICDFLHAGQSPIIVTLSLN